MQLSTRESKASCSRCGSTNIDRDILEIYGKIQCNNCLHISPAKKVQLDEFGDEIDYNERKAEWAW